MKIYQGLETNGVNDSDEIILSFTRKELCKIIDLISDCENHQDKKVANRAKKISAGLGNIPCYT